jgi:hypothetical protein
MCATDNDPVVKKAGPVSGPGPFAGNGEGKRQFFVGGEGPQERDGVTAA